MKPNEFFNSLRIIINNLYNIMMQNYYQFIIPRLNGWGIKKDFRHYLSLVKKGIAGFIVFGGELETIRKYITKLQDEAEIQLIIASDLEQGLGQQIKGGTLFPPAMAVASAVNRSQKSEIRSPKLKLLKKTFKAMAVEAKYAGINTILAPVLDINTNHRNPIISVRAFGEDKDTVSFFGCEMIKTIQGFGIAACGKHFPGHGGTEIDSHIKLPVIKYGLNSLMKNELQPFISAVKAGVKMIMLGHLSVPAIDSSGIPVSISGKAVRFLRKKMGYKGLLITDAMNMGGSGQYSEEKASFMALSAGINIILHPTNIEKIVLYLKEKNVQFDAKLLTNFRKKLIYTSNFNYINFDMHKTLSDELTAMAIKISGNVKIKGKPFLILLNDEENKKGRIFFKILKKEFPDIKLKSIKRQHNIQKMVFTDNAYVIVAVFSSAKAWKGTAGRWLLEKISRLKDKTDLFISFGNPYLLDSIKRPVIMVVYWDSDSAQQTAANMILEKK